MHFVFQEHHQDAPAAEGAVGVDHLDAAVQPLSGRPGFIEGVTREGVPVTSVLVG